MISKLLELAESGRMPDVALRVGMRALLGNRLKKQATGSFEAQTDQLYRFIATLRSAPIAVATGAANEQHYELPAAFFARALGPRLKYSSCYWSTPEETLANAEENMLKITCDRAGLADGQQILELGCGWGSLTLWMAEHYPSATIQAVSNSASQREFIEARCREKGLQNVRVHTADINDFQPKSVFDRVVSVEMFEHMRNVPALMERISSWLQEDGRLFFHVFCHKEHAYLFESEGAANWMGRYFFTGGMMPSEQLYLHFQHHLVHERTWRVNGTHYARTLHTWLKRCDEATSDVLAVLTEVYGEAMAPVWRQRWRMFFMACEELFAYEGGTEWYVAHYLFKKRA